MEAVARRAALLLLLLGASGAACGEVYSGNSRPATIGPEAWTRIATGLDRFLERLEALAEYPPGSAVIVVTADGRRYVRVHGEAKAGSGYAVTADTAFYIASMTKAYVGLLAARLDADGVLPLNTTLSAVWPGLQLPRVSRHADAISLRDLLVHSIPFTAPEITFLEAYVRDVAPSEYPRLLERYAVARQDGFQYDNLGYNIYAAALEARTGRNWREWLREKVFTPLRMTHTSGRTSGYAADTIAWSHQRAGALKTEWPQSGGWLLIPPKADGMMQSAGGLMTTANDMARWLDAQLAGRGPDGSGLTPQIFARTREDRVARPSAADGFSCDGYVYGWNVCTLRMRAKADATNADYAIGPVYQHGGGYVGVRSLMTVAPGLGLGIAFLSNSDSMTGWLSQEVTKLAVELHQDLPGADVRSDRRLTQYRERNALYLADLQAVRQKARSETRWHGWAWTPAASDLGAFVGNYRNVGALLPEATVSLLDGVLFLTTSDRRHRLVPAAPDLFGAQTFAYDDLAAVAFVRGDDRAVVALDWNGVRYGKQ